MRITATAAQLQATHQSFRQHSVSERVRVLAPSADAGIDLQKLRGDAGAGISGGLATGESAPADGVRQAIQEGTDRFLAVMRDILEKLFGIKVSVFDARELRQSTSDLNRTREIESLGNATIERERVETRVELENTEFSASGVVQTADGRQIRFDVGFTLARSESEVSYDRQLSTPFVRKQDPLVINFGGSAAELSDLTFELDLNLDGSADKAHFVGRGSGFLVLDANGNGKVDDGRELFGPQSGNGFSELAALDQDGNGWVDEGDAAWRKLQVWQKNADGSDRFMTLAEAGVGALAVVHVGTPFTLKDAAQHEQGSVRASSVYLTENGKAGTVQQIDLVV